MSNITGTTIHLDGIGHLLADNELRVPVYQRSFSWTSEEIIELLSDLWESFRHGDTEYFLGSVVLTAAAGEKPSVVDGQQRLATVSMIYAAIRDFLREQGDRRSDPLANRYLFSLNFRTEEIEPKLRLNEADDDYFRKVVLDNAALTSRSPSATTDSHKRIRNGFQTVRDYVARYARNSPKNEVANLIEWAEYLEKQAKVIVVRVPDEANAFIIFETLNDRGLDLSIADLLKNYVFGRSEGRLEEARANWIKATSALEGTGGDKRVATFIRHFWSSKQGPVREKDLYGDLKRNIRTKQAAIDFSSELAENARLYAAILNSDHEVWQPLGTDSRQHVQTLLNLRLEQYRPLLLAALVKFAPRELKKALRLLVSWNVRLLVVGGLGGGTMERYYADGGKKIRDGEIKTASGLMKYAIAFVPSDAQFEGSFSSATVSQAFLARYYLQAIEQSLRGEKHPELVPNTLEQEVNLEHILPQNPKLKEWPAFNEESAAANIKRIGNLTLLRTEDNNAGGNRPFATKKPAYARSQLKLNAAIASEKEWTAKAISERQARLAKAAPTTWPLKP
jgi:uncharacterized protein with ParB-like and HNH nuclease domain